MKTAEGFLRDFSKHHRAARLRLHGTAEGRFFRRGHELLGLFFNDWKISSVINYGSGRPVNATVMGDPNQDDNDLNDRLPGYRRNAFTGPDYATTDLRLTRIIRFHERYKLNLVAESFNLLNRDNQRVAITSNGMIANASTFEPNSVTVNIAPYPGYYRLPNNFMKPNADKGLVGSFVVASAVGPSAGLRNHLRTAVQKLDDIWDMKNVLIESREEKDLIALQGAADGASDLLLTVVRFESEKWSRRAKRVVAEIVKGGAVVMVRA